jgi:DNA (cytosine-5)-methyltransferase 1
MGFTYYDFFAGGGMAGIGLGPEWTCTFANDFDEVKASAYKAYHGDRALAVKDVRQVTAEELPGGADLAWASFPCQDLSLAGSGAGLNGERSGMFWPFWHLMRQLCQEGRAPRVIVLENVYGVLKSNGGRDFATIAGAVSAADYKLGALVIDAVHFVPQSRKRVFVAAFQKEILADAGILRQAPSPAWHPPALREAVSAFPESVRRKWVWWNLPQPPVRNSTLAEYMDDEPEGVEWHSAKETSRILALMSPLNLEKVEAAKKLKRKVVGAVYRRTRPDGTGGKIQRAEVRFDDVAGCLRTPAGGSSRQTIMVVQADVVRSRLLSPREAARLMGLPDEYPLPARYNNAYHLAGDGLVAPVVRHLAAHIIEPVLKTFAPNDWRKQASRGRDRN